MATIINNPPSKDNSGGPMGTIIVIVIVIVLGYLIFVYGLPVLQQTQSPQINVPSQVDVNIKQSE